MASVTSTSSFGVYVTTPATGEVIGGYTRIKQIIFHAGAAGDYCDLQDNDSKNIVQWLSEGTHSSTAFDMYETQYNGVKISSVNGTLSSISIIVA